jgi:hypothetical protein
VGDFNGDGKPDLAVLNERQGGVNILLGQGAGAFQRVARPFKVGGLPSALAVGDFNGDGKSDLAVVKPQINSIAVLLNNTRTRPAR